MIVTVSLNQRLQRLSELESACLKHYKIYAGAKVGERRRNKHQCTKQRLEKVLLYCTVQNLPPKPALPPASRTNQPSQPDLQSVQGLTCPHNASAGADARARGLPITHN